MSYPARFNSDRNTIEVQVGGRWRKGVERECLNCYFPFYVPATEMLRHRTNNAYASFCTKLCWAAFKSKHKSYVSKLCVVCGDMFEVTPPSHANRYKTCGSQECKAELNRRNAIVKHKTGVFA